MNLEDTIAAVRAARWRLRTHVNLSGGHGYLYECADFPVLSFLVAKHGRAPADQTYFCTSVDDEAFDTLEDAVAAMVKAECGT